MLTAITRALSAEILQCELTYLTREPIDLALAVQQHRDYQTALREGGATVIELPALPGMPDAVFVEDTAVVLDEIAIITRPGALSRQAETASVAEALAVYRPLQFIREPGTLEGGDVLRVGRILYVGLSTRTNQEGIAQLRAFTAPHGYDVQPVAVPGCLHLKTAATYLGRQTMLANCAWVDCAAWKEFRLAHVSEAEAWAANTLTVGETVLLAAGFPATEQQLTALGLNVRTLALSELRKAEAGLTCLSLLFES